MVFNTIKKNLAAAMMASILITTASGGERQHTLILGDVSIYPKEEAKILKPMVDYVASQMGDVGIRQGDFFIARDKADMVRALREGRVDWVTDTPFPALHFSQQTGAELLVRRWKKGVDFYASVFITPKESGITRLDHLPGRKIVFQDKDSSSAYYVPTALMREHGLILEELASPKAAVEVGKVGVVFGKEGTGNQVAWMQHGLAQAAAMSTLDWQELPTEVKDRMTIFHQSQPFPRGVEIVRQDLPQAVKARLKQVLLQAHQDPLAAPALQAYAKTKKFDEIMGEVEISLNYVRRLLSSCQGC